MKPLIVLFLILTAASCGKQELSEEQRSKIQQKIKERKPIKISDEQLISTSFDMALDSWSDTASSAHQWKIYYQKPDADIFRNLWEAYDYSFENSIIPDDNVQLGEKTIIYTRPLHKQKQFLGIAILEIPKKDVVLKITEEE